MAHKLNTSADLLKDHRWRKMCKGWLRSDRTPVIRYIMHTVKMTNDGHSGGVISFLDQNPDYGYKVYKHQRLGQYGLDKALQEVSMMKKGILPTQTLNQVIFTLKNK